LRKNHIGEYFRNIFNIGPSYIFQKAEVSKVRVGYTIKF